MASDSSSGSATGEAATLNLKRHVQYHQRCLKSLLPTYYTGNDSNRTLLAFFILNALDLLKALDSSISESERTDYVEWLYRCQLPSGGFRAFPGTYAGEKSRDAPGAYWDVANVAGTFFALESLVLLGDSLQRVNRDGGLNWLVSLQRPDGSFGELIGDDGRPSGTPDLRFCYMAAAIRYILTPQVQGLPKDIDAPKLVRYVLASQSYEGGFARSPSLESNAGETYCAVGTLAILKELQIAPLDGGSFAADQLEKLQDEQQLLQWLLSRQTLPEDDGDDEDSVSEDHPLDVLENDSKQLPWVGYNGRCNKPPDTCYSFWTVASLDMLGKARLVDGPGNKRFLLDRTQHQIGGFSKLEHDPPDILHSSLGLAALSLLQQGELKPLDPVLAISRDARAHLEATRRNLSV